MNDADTPQPPSSPAPGAPPAPGEPPKPGPGRPSKLTLALQEEICRAIAASGATLTAAAQIAGVDYSTLKRWIQKGKAQKRGKFRAFLAAVERARAEDKVAALARITLAGRGELPGGGKHPDGPQWRADAWKLERVHQREFAMRAYVHVDAELRAGINRLIEAFESDARVTLTKEEALELAIDALAGDAGPAGARTPAEEEDAPADSTGGEAVRPSPAQPEAASVPRANDP